MISLLFPLICLLKNMKVSPNFFYKQIISTKLILEIARKHITRYSLH
uniref:Uncharacterized protein n=1 Tax=Arundo donax TaxID=35708 RepID=A0A0A9EZZ7_ARUDO